MLCRYGNWCKGSPSGHIFTRETLRFILVRLHNMNSVLHISTDFKHYLCYRHFSIAGNICIIFSYVMFSCEIQLFDVSLYSLYIHVLNCSWVSCVDYMAVQSPSQGARKRRSSGTSLYRYVPSQNQIFNMILNRICRFLFTIALGYKNVTVFDLIQQWYRLGVGIATKATIRYYHDILATLHYYCDSLHLKNTTSIVIRFCATL